MATPRATYRLQLHKDFGFGDAAGVVDYLAELGISHVYLSPHLQAAPGSSHGYDVIDPTKINEELGGAEDHKRLLSHLERHGIGAVVDIVPNHMAISSRGNAWWWDVLENGPSSLFASYFDVDWDPPEQKLRNTVLIPVLGDHYGRVLEAGEIQIAREGGTFVIRYMEHEFPVSPKTADEILLLAARSVGSADLESIATALGRLPSAEATDRLSVRERNRDKEILRKRIESIYAEDPTVQASVDEAVSEYNRTPDLLDALLERQNYRLAFWKSGGREIDYRRFFDIDTLVGVRVEDEDVFEATHSLVLSWVESGVVEGLRVDHPDGLRDPRSYLQRLRKRAPESWIVVEKILESGEQLRADWPVEGTTGYDFMSRVAQLFTDSEGEKVLTDFYERFSGQTASYTEVVYEMKHLVMREVLASDISRLTALFIRVCEKHRRFRDYTRHEIHEAIREFIACLSVYRTYVQPAEGRVDEEDRQRIGAAITGALERRSDLDPELFRFIEQVLTLVVAGSEEGEFVFQLQQVTGAVMAKGAEDSAFYLYHRLISLNEVGGSPEVVGIEPEEFHQAVIERSKRWPNSMLATSTHDTKRSEDVRARIGLLAQIPQRWADAVEKWSADNDKYRPEDLPDRNTEYLLYQTLVGAYPLDEERAVAYLLKAAREAKAHTSWISPDETYEKALEDFVRNVLHDKDFEASLSEFVEPLIEASQISSLAQTAIKLTLPGVPDIYQGCELWDLSLVDPDNRRPVDYDVRRKLLKRVSGMSFIDCWRDVTSGAPKLWLIHRLLTLKRDRPDLFADERYEPLEIVGRQPKDTLAYVRGRAIAVIVPRFPLRGSFDGEASLQLPLGAWRNITTDEEQAGGSVSISRLFDRAPICVLVSTDG